MEMRGMHWVFLNFLRNQDGLYVDDEEVEEAKSSTE
jgi:jumonji domain-containing protein 7